MQWTQQRSVQNMKPRYIQEYALKYSLSKTFQQPNWSLIHLRHCCVVSVALSPLHITKYMSLQDSRTTRNKSGFCSSCWQSHHKYLRCKNIIKLKFLLQELHDKGITALQKTQFISLACFAFRLGVYKLFPCGATELRLILPLLGCRHHV